MARTARISERKRRAVPALCHDQNFQPAGLALLALSALLLRRLLRRGFLGWFLLLGARFRFFLRRRLLGLLGLGRGSWFLRCGGRRLFRFFVVFSGLALDDDLFHLFYASIARAL